jgi:hypothetical protein
MLHATMKRRERVLGKYGTGSSLLSSTVVAVGEIKERAGDGPSKGGGG